jgi:hypothetical protein
MEKLTADPHSEPLTDTWTSDFLSREGEDRIAPPQVSRRSTPSTLVTLSLFPAELAAISDGAPM